MSNGVKKSLSNGYGSGMDRKRIGAEPAVLRKLFASIIFLLLIGVGNAWGSTQTFTFNSTAGHTELGISSPSTGSATNLSNSTNYTLGNVTMTITHGGTYTRIYNSGGSYDLRVYKNGGSLTFSVASGYYINSIQINNSTNLSATSPTGGSWSSNTWSPKASTYPTSATFSASGTANITTIVVTYSSSCTAINPTVTYSATTLYKGETASVSSITGNTGSAGVTYSSSNSTVASVNSSTGVVTAGQAGTAKITASFAATGGYCAKDVEITFTVRYRVKWSVNGDDSYSTGSPTTYIGTHNTKVATLPSDPGTALCDGTKVFVGWTTSTYIPYSHATNAPAVLFTGASSSPNVTDNTTYYAVFANRAGSSKTYQFDITPSDFNSDGYDYNTGGTSTATATDASGATIDVTWVSNKIYKNGTDMQWKTNQGYIYNSTDLGTVNSVAVTSSAGGYNIWYGTTSHPTSGTSTGSGKGYFTVKENNTETGKTTQVRVNFTKSNYTYSNYATTCCTALGSINGSVSWTNGTKATLVWNKDANATGYVVKWKTHAGAEGTYATTNVSSINDTLTNKKTCAIPSLTAGTEYDFKIFITGKTSPTVYCDKDSVMTATAPKITATTDANLVEATYAEGSGPSTNASYFTFSGVGLTGDITVTAPTNFQVSKTSSSSGFGSSVTVSPSTGSITDQKIWICLASGLTNASSPYGGNVALSGGSAASVNVAITGSVTSACTVPIVATPTLTSIASGTITVSCASITVDDNCDLSEYGFVWKASSDPAIDDNKNAIATTYADNFSKALSISFTTGNTYKIKAFGTNVAGTTLSSSLTVTPQKVTFNSNGGSEVDDKYVNKDAKVTAPSDPTKTGYTFGGWYREVGCTNAWTFGDNVVSQDTTLYAKWTANKYDVTLKPNSGSGSDQTVQATYGSGMPLTVKTAGTAIVVPTRTGYDFNGYWDDASSGTQYYTYTGSPKALGSARNWDKASATNLYAHWTPHQHKVSVSAAANGTITATPAGGSAISEGSYNATVDYDKTITLGWTKDDHYSTLVWTVHKDGDESTTVSVTGSGNGATFTMPDYDVVVKATITEDPYTLVTFKNNGTAISGYEDVKYYSGRPTAPTMTDGHSTGDACDEDSEVFYGWTTDSWEYKISKSAASAKTIYKKGDNLPTVAASGDVVVYNAVWAEEVEGDDWEVVTSLSNIKEGKAYLGSYINYSSSWRWYMATAANESKTVTVSGTPKKLSSTTGLLEVTLVATATANQYYIKDGNDKYLYANNTGDVLEFSATSCAWTFSSYDNYMFVVLSSLGTYYMRGFASSTSAGGIRTYASSSTNSGICLFQKGTDLSNFMTHCCADLITLGTPSISNGTIEYDWDSPIPTCNSGKTVTATITPSTGYKVTALTFSGGSVSYDDPDFPITSATNVTLTFAQNTDAATLSASATTAAIPVTSLKLRAQQTEQDDKIGNDLTMTCYPKEGQTGGNDPLNHTLKVLFEEVLPANALDKTYDWSVRVKAKDDADWTDVDFTSNTLNTNSIINAYNKSTGNLQIKATEGTAEIKITAHDGSGVTAKVTITVANVAMTGVSVDPTSMTVYAGQKKAVAVTFAPLNATNKAYSAGSSYTYVNLQNKAAATFYIEGKTSVTSATANETVTVTTTDGSFTATVDVTIKPLPLVHFVDNVHNESFDDVVATTDGTTVTFAKTTPTHDDLDEPGTGNSCEKTHLHLIGWIRGDWPAYVAYMNGTGDAPSNSDLTGATGYFYAPGASITLTDAMHCKTFYAIWAKVE